MTTPAREPANARLEAQLAAELAQVRAVGRGRSLRTFDGIDFSSNDYLGIARMQGDAIPLVGSTGSRLLSGQSEAWAHCEEALASWHGHASGEDVRALVFPSGYVANEGLLSTLIGRDDWVASDALNHGSIIDGLRLSRAQRAIYRHQDLDHLRDLLRQAPKGNGHRFVVTESLFGMDGDRTDLGALAELCREHGALLIVDEAHATGCFGPEGSGLVDAEGLRDAVLATVHTCGKALGSHGAYVVTSPVIRDALVQNCRHFIFTTALPPAMAAHIERSVEIVRRSPELRERLHGHATRVHSALFEVGGRHWQLGTSTPSHIVPILVGTDAAASAWASALHERDLRVPAIRPPTVPEGEARLRISLCADHTDTDLDALLAALTETVPR